MVGGWQIPISTGMTIGEFARMANDMREQGAIWMLLGSKAGRAVWNIPTRACRGYCRRQTSLRWIRYGCTAGPASSKGPIFRKAGDDPAV